MNPDSALHLSDSTHLAANRTWLAHERTLMAWVRTGTSMISFGFTIYKFFQLESKDLIPIRKTLLSPRDFGLIMVSIGLLSLLPATSFQHRIQVRELKPTPPPRSLAEIVGAIVSIFGFV